MKLTRLTTSLFALALFAVPAFAQQDTTAAPAQPAASQPAAGLQAFLADQRPASALSVPELRKRLKAGRDLIQSKSLDAGSLRQVRGIMVDARTELQNRQGSGGQKQQTQQQAQQPAQATQQQTQQTTQPAQTQTQQQPSGQAPATAPAATTAPAGLDQLLADSRPASALSDAELKQRFNSARSYLPNAALTAQQRQSLQQLARDSRAELGRRAKGSQPAQTGTAGQQQQQAGTGQPQTGTAGQQQAQAGGQPAAPTGGQMSAPANANTILADRRALDTMSVEELRARIRSIRDAQKSPGLTPQVKQQLNQAVRAARMEIMSRGGLGATMGNGQPGKGNNTGMGNGGMGNGQPGGPVGGVANPDAERRAQAFLNPVQNIEQMPNPALRQRLLDMRTLLQANQLSPATQRALRQRLASERQVLRGRVGMGQPGMGNGQPGMGNGQPGGGQGAGNTTINITVVLADRRPPQQLQPWELRRRIDVYRDAVMNQQYAAAQRAEWQRMLAADRAYMHQELMDRRRARMAELARERQANQLNINMGMQFDPGRPPPPSGFAAEMDEGQIEDVLTAPPRRAISRRYSVQEVESSPDLRDALPRVELDTIHFGFGESFVREEEVDNLDHVAQVLEKILTAHPREVFIIEGHTDAVGSPEANLELSRKRAEAVKQALVDYYVIPPQNLQTIGYGERFLKIPTPDPEAENRRVSVVRATPLVGELPD